MLSLIDDDDTFYRVDNSSNNNHQLNFLVSSRLNTTSIYWSLINPCIAEFSENNGICLENSYQFYGINSRAWLLSLFSTKYFVTSDKKAAKKSVPYGYNYVGEKPGEYGTCLLYRSNNALPFEYTFDKVIALRDYQQMSISQRQQVLLQGAVLKNADTEAMGLAACQPSYSDKTISYKIKPGKNITISGNQIIVKEDKAKLRLKLDKPREENCMYPLPDSILKATRNRLPPIPLLPKSAERRNCASSILPTMIFMQRGVRITC